MNYDEREVEIIFYDYRDTKHRGIFLLKKLWICVSVF